MTDMTSIKDVMAVPDPEEISRDAEEYHEWIGCDDLDPGKVVTEEETRIFCQNCRVVIAKL